MGVDGVNVQTAHRLGVRGGPNLRPIIATFVSTQDGENIMKKTNTLKATKHYISRQMPQDKQERMQFAMGEFIKKNTCIQAALG